MVEDETTGRVVFRLLELIALLLPVVAILVQASVNTYREQEGDISASVRFSTLTLLLLGVVVLLRSAHLLASHLQDGGYGVRGPLGGTLGLLKGGLVLVGLSVVFLALPLLKDAGVEFGGGVWNGGRRFVGSLTEQRSSAREWLPGSRREARERLSDWKENDDDDTSENAGPEEHGK